MDAIRTKGLTKSFGDITAVDGISFQVRTGEIFGFLGPNGAGKSTTMMILTTLLKPTSGEAVIAGFDVRKDPNNVRRSIGYVQQDDTVDEYLTGRENLRLQARLAHMSKEKVAPRIDEMLQLVELEDRQHEPVIAYSGGMRKRLEIASGLLHMPNVLFLDEPTVGLDIQTRRKIWEYVKRIRKEYGTTVFLTTHYMEEADALCDRVGIIDGGRIMAIDSPSSMKESLGGELVSIGVRGRCEAFVSELGSITDSISKISRDPDSGTISMYASNCTEVIPLIFRTASGHDVKIETVTASRPTLDDVFLSYTGHEIRDGASGTESKSYERARVRRRRA